jgi:hypothetical protein
LNLALLVTLNSLAMNEKCLMETYAGKMSYTPNYTIRHRRTKPKHSLSANSDVNTAIIDLNQKFKEALECSPTLRYTCRHTTCAAGQEVRSRQL